MTCEYGHDFKPFPRSRDLYCSACGAQPGRAAAAAPTQLLEKLASSVELPPSIESLDPDRDAALSIMNAAAQSKKDEFELQVVNLINRYDLPEEAAHRFFQMAVDFGPGLDMEYFENSLLKPVSEMQKASTSMDEDLDRAFDVT